MTLFWQRRTRRGSQRDRPRFSVGQLVVLTRDLPTQRANAEGTIRGLTPTLAGINYAIRFQDGMRIVREGDLRIPNVNDAEASQAHGEC